jgi:hypothetical protein
LPGNNPFALRLPKRLRAAKGFDRLSPNGDVSALGFDKPVLSLSKGSARTA